MLLFLFAPVLAAAPAAGPAAPIVAAVGAIGSALFGLFRGAHRKKEALEDQISREAGPWWMAQMKGIRERLSAGTISPSQAAALADEVEAKFAEVTAVIKKGDSKLDQARPGKGCNWACGSLWDVHEAGKAIKAEASRLSVLQKPAASALAPVGQAGSVAPVVGLGLLGYLLYKIL